MKKIFYTTVFALGICASAFSQGSVTYKITKDDPYDIKNFSLAIDPLFFDVNAQNGYSMGWGLRADYLMGKRLQVNFDFRNGFGTKGYNINDKNTRNYSAFEAALGLVLSHKTKTKNLPIVLSSSSYSSGGYTYTKTVSIKGGVPGRVRKLVMLQAGLYQMGNSLNYEQLYDSLLTFEGANTFSFRDSVSSFTNKYGAYASTAIFGGFNFKNIRQLILDVDGYGIRSNKMYSDFYIHAIFSPVLTVKNYELNGTKYNVKYEEKQNIGWRMGWMYRQPKEQGFSMKFEFGQRPLISTAKEQGASVNWKNFYAMLTYGLYVPLRVEPIAEDE